MNDKQKHIIQSDPETCEVVVIGGGPAGLACAYAAGKRKLKTVLLEKNESPGKKLLITGTGQCNITHAGSIEDFPKRFGLKEKERFVKPALLHFTNRDLYDLFAEHGVWLTENADGKLFPESRKSRDVLDLLCRLCYENHVVIETKSSVVSIVKTETGFTTKTVDREFASRAVVIAAGGQSFPSTGSSGDGFRLAAELGHSITPISPGLSPVVIKNYEFAQCSGIAIENAGIALSKKENPTKITHKTVGDVLFTHRGMSGPGILDSSRYFSKGDVLRFNWFGNEKPEQIEKLLTESIALAGKKTLKRVISQLETDIRLPERLIGVLLRTSEIPDEIQACYLEKPARKRLVCELTAKEMVIESLGNFSEAMITCGGVALSQINRNRMESRLVPNLYFSGEVLDIDGDTGGFNLQFAISSGILAGNSI